MPAREAGLSSFYTALQHDSHMLQAARCFVFYAKLDISSLQGNVKESRFNKAFFQRFAIVLNGLDNVEARRHVNRLCLSAGTPLIESGTEGYLGQVGRISYCHTWQICQLTIGPSKCHTAPLCWS